MVYFGDSEDTDLFRIHEEIAKNEERVDFAHADVKCAAQFESGLKEGLVFFKTEEDTILQYDGAEDQESIHAWIKAELKTLVMDLTEEN